MSFVSINFASGLPSIAGGCNSNMIKNSKIECTEEETNCQKNKSIEYVFDKSVNS